MRRFRALWALLIPLLLLVPRAARAQFFGLGDLLNPEGSRLFPQTYLFPRHPGKPDPRWETFRWQFVARTVEGSKYRLFFDQSAEWTAELVAPKIDEQVLYLSKVFDLALPKTFDYVLFNSERAFQQANIFDISEGVQGITSTTEASMAIPYWGEMGTFEHISTHELVHQFQVQKINKIGGYYAMDSERLFPLWFIEGMAEYYSLHGVDPKSSFYLRDLLVNPKPKESYKAPKFFEEGPLNFVGVYKLGQARCDFLDKTFGTGTVQRILEKGAKRLGQERITFQTLVTSELKVPAGEIEKKWQAYLASYKEQADSLQQDAGGFQEVKGAGDELDTFAISPDGKLLATREIDSLTGRTYIRLMDLSNPGHKLNVTKDETDGVLSLQFMEYPIVTLGDDVIAYTLSTTSGPAIEFRSIRRHGHGSLELGGAHRIPLGSKGLVQVSYPALSPDQKQIAFVGLDAESKGNVYLMKLERNRAKLDFHALTAGYYSWKSLSWGDDGILAVSDRADPKYYNIYRIDPVSGALTRLTQSEEDQDSPTLTPSGLLYTAWAPADSEAAGTSQAYLRRGAEVTQLTEVKTELISPVLRGKDLYAIAFRSGRFHLYRIGPTKRLGIASARARAEPLQLGRSWTAELADFTPASIQPYKPFRTSGIRLDNIAGFFGSGSVGGLTATVSDLMRNYSITGEMAVLGSFKYTEGYTFVTSSKGRSTWTLGAYNILQTRLDELFPTDDFVRTYLHREYGALGAIQYPLTAFSYLDFTMRVAGVDRSQFSDPALLSQWNALNPGNELLLSPVVRLGFDHILYELFTGPLKGWGILLEDENSYYPGRGDFSERYRIDASYYLQTVKRMVIAFQGVAGASVGGTFRNPFFVSSDDILRGYEFGDPRLLGNYVVAGKTELRFPIGSVFKFPPLRGFVGYDVGSVFSHRADLGRNIEQSATLGLSLNFPPISVNFMQSYAIRTAPGPIDRHVFHFTFRYLYL